MKYKRFEVFEKNDTIYGASFLFKPKGAPAATYLKDTFFNYQKIPNKTYCAIKYSSFIDTNTLDTANYVYVQNFGMRDTFLQVTNNCYPLAISEFNKPLMYFSNQYLYSNATIQKIIISNLYGQTVYKSTNAYFPSRLPLMSGIYLVQYWVDDKRYVMKIQVE
jgi:hypothetical protein